MFTKGIKLENFTNKKKLSKIKLSLKDTLRENNEIIKSLQSNYKYSFSKRFGDNSEHMQNNMMSGRLSVRPSVCLQVCVSLSDCRFVGLSVCRSASLSV